MLYHVIFPDNGGYVSVDYRESLREALEALRYWQRQFDEKGALALGKNGKPLEHVVYSRHEGEKDSRPVSVHATTLGAKRAMLKFGREHGFGRDSKLQEYGHKPVTDW